MASSVIPGYVAMSDLLTIREKGVLFTLLGPQCKLIKSTVAQVMVAKETQAGGPDWTCLGCGVVCLIKDESIPSYFLRLYCVKRAKLLWEQELYIPFKYTVTRPFLHTFPADDHQVGLNFADEPEAEEFEFAVQAVKREQETMTVTAKTTNTEKEDSSSSDLPDLGIHPPDQGLSPLSNPGTPPSTDKQKRTSTDPLGVTTPQLKATAPEHLGEEQQSLEDAPFSNLFKDLDPAMRRLLIQARFTEKDLRDKDIAESVDCIINQFGGLKAVRRELKSRGPVSQTLPRSAGSSISLALRKGPLPPIPAVKGDSAPLQRSPGPDNHGQIPSWVPPPPSAPAPSLPERKSASFKHVRPPGAAASGDLVLAALRKVFRQKQQRTSADHSQTGVDADVE